MCKYIFFSEKRRKILINKLVLQKYSLFHSTQHMHLNPAGLYFDLFHHSPPTAVSFSLMDKLGSNGSSPGRVVLCGCAEDLS